MCINIFLHPYLKLIGFISEHIFCYSCSSLSEIQCSRSLFLPASAASTPKARVHSFRCPSGQTEQEETCRLWGCEFKGEHLSQRGKLWPLQWDACDLSPQLCAFKSHVSMDKHTCWKACWEWSLVLSTHARTFKMHLLNQIRWEVTSGNLRTTFGLPKCDFRCKSNLPHYIQFT